MDTQRLKLSVEQELQSILSFWIDNSLDSKNGGFIGKLDGQGNVHADAVKGGVLNARILWTFSKAYNQTQNPEYLKIADRAYSYILNHFIDKEHGGTFWSLNADGSVLDGRKQIYSLAFSLYGLSEYYLAGQNTEALNFSIDLFKTIEEKSFDSLHNGYWEAFTQDWKKLEDVRLSEKERNDPKTMNTHLHIIEAYVNLYRVWPDQNLKNAIYNLLEIFELKILNEELSHLNLFFDAKWRPQSFAISYGHDIEASWLLYEAAEVLKDSELINKWSKIAIKIAEGSLEGLNPDGSLNHEFDPSTNHLDSHREWWVSAEAMVGFANVYHISKDEKYLKLVFGFWEFIQNHLIDNQNGEWFWGVFDDYSKMDEDKIGFWKCPYHNARACIEIVNRLT
jgi:mannobiose 2-epimerase